jgi:hypothetical protein
MGYKWAFKGLIKIYSSRGLDRPFGFQELETLRISKKAVSLLALSTGRLYLTGDIPVTHYC